MLIVRGGSIALAQPYEFSRQARAGNPDRILAVDLGINKAATCVIVEADGTVIAQLYRLSRSGMTCSRSLRSR